MNPGQDQNNQSSQMPSEEPQSPSEIVSSQPNQPQSITKQATAQYFQSQSDPQLDVDQNYNSSVGDPQINPTSEKMVKKSRKLLLGLGIMSIVFGTASHVAFFNTYLFIPSFIFIISSLLLGFLSIKYGSKLLPVIGIVFSAITLIFLLVRFNPYTAIYFLIHPENTIDDIRDEIMEEQNIIPTGYKREGQSNFGYLNIPEDWVTFSEIGSTPGTMMQYSDPSGFSVLTVTKYPKNSDFNSFTGLISKYLISTGPSFIETSATVGDYSAKKYSQIYHDENKVFDTFAFEESDYFATISIEYKTEDQDIAETIVKSYSLRY